VRIARRVKWGVGALALVALALPMSYRWWVYHRDHVTTDDAYVRADVSLVTPRVPGVISELLVQEHQQVEKGALLLRLDPAGFQIKLDQAEAALAAAREGVLQRRAAVLTADSSVKLVEVELAQARIDETRVTRLSARDAAPTEQVERVRTARAAVEARLVSARRAADQAQAMLGIPMEASPNEAAMVRQAQAMRDEASLLLSYTELRAPVGGVVAKRSGEVGQAVQPGQPLMMLVPLEGVYIEANFKESQLADVRVGQAVLVTADLYPGANYTGHVLSLSPGSGAAFSLLPAENASGNWVKVVQRIPVRIALNGPFQSEQPLRIGTSVVASVDVRSDPEPKLAQARRGERER
jgi:membrane fusion protein (multidrug efflux system)